MIPSESSHLNVTAISHAGMSGKNNEDRYSVAAHLLDNRDRLPSLLAVVADGIGGHLAGEVAAEITIEVINQVISESDGEQPVNTLAQAIKQASQVIIQNASVNPKQKGMGSTCACAWVIGNHLYTATVGDSRIYLIRSGQIHQLNRDHTWIQEALKSGAITPEQARNHPNVHIIRRYLGSAQEVVPDTRVYLSGKEDDAQAKTNQGLAILPGDILLLSTDGLTDLVSDAEINSTISNLPPEEALHKLVELANQRGGHDNITVVGLQAPNQASVSEPVSQKVLQRKYVLACAITAFSIAGIIALISSGYWFYNRLDSILPNHNLETAPIITDNRVPWTITARPGTSTPDDINSIYPATSRVPGELSQPSPPSSSPPLPMTTLTPWPTNTPVP
jgi:serine/threonine protein phosphatase PrpC